MGHALAQFLSAYRAVVNTPRRDLRERGDTCLVTAITVEFAQHFCLVYCQVELERRSPRAHNNRYALVNVSLLSVLLGLLLMIMLFLLLLLLLLLCC